MLHIKAVAQAVVNGVRPGDEGGVTLGTVPITNIRLEQYDSGLSNYWDLTSGAVLDFSSGMSTNSMSSRMTISPTSLHFKGNTIRGGVNENQFTLGSQNAPSGNLGQFIAFGANPLSGGWSFTGNSSNNGGSIIQGDDAGNLFFITRGKSATNLMNLSQTAANVKLFIASDGNIGIGTNSPTAKIQVNNGNIFVNNGKVGIGTNNFTDPTTKLEIQSGDMVLNNGTIFLSQGGKKEIELKANGLIHAREIEVDLVLIPDYVFDLNYDLMPLAELKTYINNNRHLPNVPSAKEYEERGSIALKELNIKLLEKVEELTLYTLEQEEELNSLKKQVSEMQRILNSLSGDK